jgi:Spy/CpxP family protein refolding chaperone
MKISFFLLSFALFAACAPATAQHPGHGQGNGHGQGHGHAHRSESSHAAHGVSPYAGEQTRDIKALSQQEQRGWIEGQGMGMARAAELNGYPGPMHVLELADRLQLTDAQAAETRALMDRHKAEVRRLGVQLVDAERELDRMFRDKQATEAEVQRHSEAIAKLQGQIRSSHLQTHLKQTELLTAAQIERYNTLRGYR